MVLIKVLLLLLSLIDEEHLEPRMYYEQHFRSIQSIECLECVPLEKAFALHNFWYRGAIDMQQTFLTFFFGYYTTTFLYHIDLSNPEVTWFP